MSDASPARDHRWIVLGVIVVDMVAATILGLLLGAQYPGSWGVLLSVAVGAYALALLQSSLITGRGPASEDWLVQNTIERVASRHRASATQQRHEELARRAETADMAVEVLHDVGNFASSISTTLDELQCAVDHGLLPHVERALDLVAQSGASQSPPASDASAAFLSAARRTLAEEKRRLQDELRHADQLLKCIADMVSTQQMFARGTRRESVEPTEPADIVRAALAMNAAAFRRDGILVEANLQPVGRVPLARTQLLQVINNLLKNAAEAVGQQTAGKRQIEVTLAGQDDDWFQIRVTDSGCGIPNDQLSAIFEHGFTTKLSGHGFGLSSCARLVQQFDGSLTAASEGAGRGAAFTITMPRQRRAESTEPVAVVGGA